MPASLLDSQFATLEPLEDDERGFVVDVDQSVDQIVEAGLAARRAHHEENCMTPTARPSWPNRARRTRRPRLAAGHGRPGRHRPHRRPDHGRQDPPVPRADHRRPDRRHRRRGRPRRCASSASARASATTAAGVGILIALGAMFAKLLADSGGADQIVDTIVGRARPRMLPWAMALVGRDHRPADVLRDRPGAADAGHLPGRPARAALADRRRHPGPRRPVGHARLVPPHPGPLIAIDSLGADLGVTLALGVLVAIPTVMVAGPLFGPFAGSLGRRSGPRTGSRPATPRSCERPRPSFPSRSPPCCCRWC